MQTYLREMRPFDEAIDCVGLVYITDCVRFAGVQVAKTNCVRRDVEEPSSNRTGTGRRRLCQQRRHLPRGRLPPPVHGWYVRKYVQ